MPTFVENNRPDLPGVYFRFEGQGRPKVAPSIGTTVAIAGTHDWGPDEVPTLVLSMSEFEEVFGATYSPLYIAVNQAFRGEGVDNIGGAGAVLVFRMTGAAGAKALKTLSNTTPAVALTLTAKYPGARGNDLRVTTQDNAADALKTDLILLDGTTEIERYTFLDANIADAAAQINANSQWVTAVADITGVPLGIVAAQAFASGDSGTTLISGDYTTMMTGLEQQRFSFFAAANLTDGAILASLKTWVVGLQDIGRRFIAVVGGAAAETIATAITRSGTLNSEHFVNLGGGTYADDHLLDASGVATVLSTAQLAPRMAGILAQRGMGGAATFARLAGLRITAPAVGTPLAAFDGGVVPISLDSDIEAPVHLESSVTTYTTKTNTAKPFDIFRRPKYVHTMGRFEIDLQDFSQRRFIGRLNVNAKTRDAVLGKAQEILSAYQTAGGVKEGRDGYSVAASPTATDEDEFIDVLVGMKFGRSLEQVFFITKIS